MVDASDSILFLNFNPLLISFIIFFSLIKFFYNFNYVHLFDEIFEQRYGTGLQSWFTIVFK